MVHSKSEIINFTSGRQILLPGGVVSINRNLELADYYSRNILYLDNATQGGNVVNIHNLTKDELIELSDMMIQLWIELKNNVRHSDITNPGIFNCKKRKKTDPK